MNRFLTLLCLLLAACGGGPTPAPPSPPAPPPVTCQAVGQACPPSGALSWSLNTAAPGNIALYCADDGPNDSFQCHLPTGADWGVLNAPGNYGAACVNYGAPPLFPLPNGCYQPSPTGLGFSVAGGGMALMNASSLDPSVSFEIEMTVQATNNCAVTDVSYVGPVAYNGEANYFAEYLQCNNNSQIFPFAYGPVAAPQLSTTPIVPGSTHTLRIDNIPSANALRYVMDNVVLAIVPTYTFTAPPHWALWTGEVQGQVLSWNIYIGGT